MITGFSCEEEYDHYMQGQAEAEARSMAEEAEAIQDAVLFLIKAGITPDDYKAAHDALKEKGEC